MEEFNSLLSKRRSYRKYTNEHLSGDEVQLILEAALLSPSSKGRRSWEFIVVEDKEMLIKLSHCKPQNVSFIANAAMVVVVLGNPLDSDAWIEDSSIASFSMQLQAEALDIGSCWIQLRERNFAENITTSEYINDLLDVPMPLQPLSIISFGRKIEQKDPANLEALMWEKVHIGKYTFLENQEDNGTI